MKIRKALLVLTFFLLYPCTCCASNSDRDKLDIISFLSSSKIIDNKIYIEPGMIYVLCDQIFLDLEDYLLPIEDLSSDDDGIFITVEEFLTARNIDLLSL